MSQLPNTRLLRSRIPVTRCGQFYPSLPTSASPRCLLPPLPSPFATHPRTRSRLWKGVCLEDGRHLVLHKAPGGTRSSVGAYSLVNIGTFTPFSGTSPLPLGLFPLAHAGVLDVFLISDSVSLAHYLAVILSSLSRHHATILQPSATKPSPQFLSSLCHVAVMPRAACLPCRLALAPKEINAINTAASPSLAPHARQSHPRLTTSLLLPVSRASTHVTQLNLP